MSIGSRIGLDFHLDGGDLFTARRLAAPDELDKAARLRDLLMPGAGVGSLASGVITFPALKNFCRVTGVVEIKGVDVQVFTDATPLTFFVTDASPSNVVKILHKATVAVTAFPFWLAPLAGQTAGQTIVLKTPSTVLCWVDTSSSCIRLQCVPMGSIGT